MINKITNLKKIKPTRYWTKKFLPEIVYNYIYDYTSFLNNTATIAERVFCIENNITKYPLCKYCKNRAVKRWKGVNTTLNSYYCYCSISCARKDKKLERHICKNPACNNQIKTLGNQYCSCKCSATDSKTKKLRKQTNIDKYGITNVSKLNTTIQKIKNTKKMKYGDENYNNYNKTQTNKIYKYVYNRFERFKDSVIPLFNKNEYKGSGYNKKYKWKCVKCNVIFYHWYKNGLIPKCPCCTEPSTIESKIHNLLNNWKIPFYANNRIQISPLELDIYIPEKKIAIECNGLYWHSYTEKDDINYHLNKTELCNQKNIQLIHIFEDEMNYKFPIIKNRLRNILGKIKYSIGARKCKIKEISTKLKNKFLTKYHLQGKDNSSIKLGLFYKNRLIAIMTFGKRRFDNKQGYELYRYCTIGNFRIIGGAGKLLKYFERNYQPKSIITYADRKWSNGNLYKQINFNFIRFSSPGYFYMKDYKTRLSRHQFMKHKLKDKINNFDENLTEWENMKSNGYDKIYDCGNYVFTKTN